MKAKRLSVKDQIINSLQILVPNVGKGIKNDIDNGVTTIEISLYLNTDEWGITSYKDGKLYSISGGGSGPNKLAACLQASALNLNH